MDLFWSGKLLVEMKSTNKDLDNAMARALQYYSSLNKDDEPTHILACDFQNWYLLNKENNARHRFKLDELPDKIGLFGFMIDKPAVYHTDPVNEQAGKIMAEIHDSLVSGQIKKGEGAVEYFLTRIVFCLFADDTGIFEHGSFQKYIKDTKKDGSDLELHLGKLFDVLDTPESQRSKKVKDRFKQFQYIDGELFYHLNAKFPEFTYETRELLIKAGEYDWSKVSPVIFGSMFQNVMDQNARREIGAHYTTEENILKVIRPLFLNQLYIEFDGIMISDNPNKINRYKQLQTKLSRLTFFDPACGSGNFLSIAYRELRRFEHDVIYQIKLLDDNAEIKSMIDVHQFYGIELVRFSAKIAEVSIWMMDHLMNRELSEMFDDNHYRFPLSKKPYIKNTDALEIEWNDILPADKCDYILGNPPFGGSKMISKEQRNQIVQLANKFGIKGGTLDYVSGWFIKTGQYIQDHTKIGFVATNSITQGEQVGQLWFILDQLGLEIQFAYKSFRWNSETHGKAGIIVIILGISKQITDQKQLYDDNTIKIVSHITPYLNAASKKLPIVQSSSKQLNDLPDLIMGSKPIDGGHYIFTEQEKDEFLKLEPKAEKYMRPYLSGEDFLNGVIRYILALHDISPNELKKMPHVLERVKKVKKFRYGSSDKSTRKLGDTPRVYHLNVLPVESYLLIPSTSSEKRKYVPIGFIEPPIIPSNSNMIIQDATLGLFGLLTSRLHNIWLSVIGGRLGTSFRYSAAVVYNTFPVPKNNLCILETYSQNILDIRSEYDNSTLVDLYDPDTMPDDLLKAHQQLDKAVEKLYRKEPFIDDDDRIEFLLNEYSNLVGHQTTFSA